MSIKEIILDIKVKIFMMMEWIIKRPFIKRIFRYALVFFVFWLLYFFLKEPIIELLKQNPMIWNTVVHIMDQISNKTYLGLLYVGIIGAFAFIAMPVEIISLYYFHNGYNPFFVIIVAVSGIMIGLSIDYIIGIIFGRKLVQYTLKEKFDLYEHRIEKYGGWLLFGLSLIMCPIGIFVIFYATMHYSFKKMFKIIFWGQLIKFILLYMFMDYISGTVIPTISSIV